MKTGADSASPLEIAGFWRRFFAFFIDTLILGALGVGLGWFAFDALVALGSWGRVLGFAIAVIYFGAMDSVLFRGQSWGKRCTRVKVVRVDGAPLSVNAAAIRASVFLLPYFLSGAFVNAGRFAAWWAIFQGFVVLGVGSAILYLLIFNRRTRQSLHDLAVGAYVTSAKIAVAADEPARIWSTHFLVVGLLLIAGVLLPFLTQNLASSPRFAALLSVQQGLEQDPAVRHASVTAGVTKFFSKTLGATTAHVVDIRVFVSKRVVDLDPLANRLAQTIFDRDPAAKSADKITIAIIYGYDIGIASAWQTRGFAFSPQQWEKRIVAP